MTHDEIIEQYVTKLGLSLAEAEQLYQDEKSDNLPNLDAEQAKVAKDMARADRKKETTTRRRERKIDADKRILIALLRESLVDEVNNILVVNPEREITFDFFGEKYQLTLVKKRKEKVK